MIKILDYAVTDNRVFLLFYVSQLLSFAQVEIDRKLDITKCIEYFKDLTNLRTYLNT